MVLFEEFPKNTGLSIDTAQKFLNFALPFHTERFRSSIG
jgi:hypothetical protein